MSANEQPDERSGLELEIAIRKRLQEWLPGFGGELYRDALRDILKMAMPRLKEEATETTKRESSQWQPIETLPKTHGGQYSDYHFLACWENGKWRVGKGSKTGDMFIEHGVGPIKATHWMPFPNPPVIQDQEIK